MKYIDTHTHLYLPEFDEDRRAVVESAIEKGVGTMLLPNIDSATISNMMQLCADFPDVFHPMMGLHPGSVREDYLDELKIIKEYFNTGKYIAIGEVGIDLYWDKTFVTQQIHALEIQSEIARDLQLPVVIHARNSFREIFDVLKRFPGLTGVFHSFTGSRDEAGEILDLGFYIGINGIVTFKNSGLDKVVSEIPLNRILLETDSPYLSPVPKRGIRNESSHLVYINEFLAKLFKIPESEMAEITCSNAKKLFKL